MFFKKIMLLCCVCFPMRAVFAQTPLFSDASANLPTAAASGQTMDVLAVDIDLDGDPDIILANEFQRNRLLLNDGSGLFTDGSTGRFSNISHDSEDIAVADFNNDGWPDVVFAAEDDAAPEYYWSTGGGNFADSSHLLPSSIANSVATRDLNGDGFPDLLFGNSGPEIILINNGAGHFTDQTATRLPGQSSDVTQDIKLYDIDNDGDMDLLLGNEDQNKLYINTGNGFFEDQSAARLPQGINQETRKIEAGDVDNDGDPDLFLSNVNFIPGKNPQDRLLLNNGSGYFTDSTATHLPADSQGTLDGIFHDVDDDNDLDLVCCYFPNAAYKVLLNNGQGHFSDQTATVLPSGGLGNGLGVIAADLNNDGRRDLYFCNRGGKDKLYFKIAVSGTAAPVRQPEVITSVDAEYVTIRFSTEQAVQNLSARLLDTRGRVVRQENIRLVQYGEQSVRLSRAGLPAGVYVVELKGTGLQASVKVNLF